MRYAVSDTLTGAVWVPGELNVTSILLHLKKAHYDALLPQVEQVDEPAGFRETPGEILTRFFPANASPDLLLGLYDLTEPKTAECSLKVRSVSACAYVMCVRVPMSGQ